MSLVLKDLSVMRSDGTAVVTPVNAKVIAGRPLAIMGPSGVGKTSLLNAIAGFLPSTLRVSGACDLNGVPILDKLPEQRRIGVMFQDALLFPHLTVGQNLGFALDAAADARADVIADALARAGLAGFADRRPHTLSGGQRSRVALMRALLARPDALLLDEAFANLDSDLRAEFRAFTLENAQNIPVIMVTHDRSDAEAAADIIELAQPA